MKHWYQDLRVGFKLALAFGTCLAISVVMGIAANIDLTSLNQGAKQIYDDPFSALYVVAKGNDAFQEITLRQYRAVNADSATRAKLFGEIKDLQAKLADSLSTGTKSNDEADRQQYSKLEVGLTNYDAANQELERALNANDRHSALLALGRADAIVTSTMPIWDSLIERNLQQGRALSAQADVRFHGAQFRLVAWLLCALACGSLLAFFVSKGLVMRLSLVGEQMNRLRLNCVAPLSLAIDALEHGDLTIAVHSTTEPVPTPSNDEIGRLAATFNDLLTITKGAISSFNQSQGHLRDLMADLQSHAGTIGSSSRQLTATAQQLSAASNQIGASMNEVAHASEQASQGASEVAQGSAVQARTLAETTTLVQRLAASVEEAAAHAIDTARVANEAGMAATEGTSAMERSLQGMTTIQAAVGESADVIAHLGESSQRIGSIVETINEIADQTNLLALNAAIEAARAGEAGRGFAVVADEVRRLAERSAHATKEIGQLIDDIQKQTQHAISSVESGSREVKAQVIQAETTIDAFRRIQASVTEVSERVEQIKSAATAMTVSSSTVSRSMADIAAVVEQSSAAAEELSASADEVASSVLAVAGASDDQMRAVHTLVDSSSDLQTVSQALSDAIGQFKVQEGNPPLRVAA